MHLVHPVQQIASCGAARFTPVLSPVVVGQVGVQPLCGVTLAPQPRTTLVLAEVTIPTELLHHGIEIAHGMKHVQYHRCPHQLKGSGDPGGAVPQAHQGVLRPDACFTKQASTGGLEGCDGPYVSMQDPLTGGLFGVDHHGFDLNARTVSVQRLFEDKAAVQLGHHDPSRHRPSGRRLGFKRTFAEL